MADNVSSTQPIAGSNKVTTGEQLQPARPTRKLNYDTLVHMFQYLPDKKSLVSVAKVCNAWKTAAYDKRLWRDFLPNIASQHLSDRVAESFRDRDVRAIRLAMDNDGDRLSNNIRNIKEHMHVEILLINQFLALDYITKQLPQRYDSLRVLSLSHLGEDLITPAGLDRLFSPLCNLEQLLINWEPVPPGIEQIRKDLKLTGAKTDLGFNYFESVFFHLPKLKDLEIYGIGRCIGFDFSMIFPKDSFPNIERLVLYRTAENLEWALKSVTASVFPNLKHLTLHTAEYELDLQSGIPTYVHDHLLLESLSANSISYTRCMLENIDLISKMSHLQALDISLPSPQSKIYFQIKGKETLQEEHVEMFLTNLPGLKMLNVFGHSIGLQPFNDHVTSLKNMEVLVLGPFWWRDLRIDEDKVSFIGNLHDHWAKLQSLFGILFDERSYGILKHVKYVSGTITVERWDQDVMQLSLDNKTELWRNHNVSQGTMEWQKAVGSQFFRLADSYFFGNDL